MAKLKKSKYYPPTAENFIMARRLACITKENASKMLHVDLKTISNWETGKTTIP